MIKWWQMRTGVIRISMLFCFAFFCMSPATAETDQQGINPVEPVATIEYASTETNHINTPIPPVQDDGLESHATENASNLASEMATSETFSPSSAPDATPAPSANPTPDASVSPDVSEQPSPTPSATVTDTAPTAEAIQVRSLYLQGPSTVGAGDRVTFKLMLSIQNASGKPLLPFGVRLDISSGGSLSSASMTRSDSVTFRSGLLWVEDAVAKSGTVAVEGDSLRCEFACVPFPAEKDWKSVTITLTLTDASGHAVQLKDSDANGQMIQTSYKIRRQQFGAESTEEPVVTETPVDSEGTASQPEESDASENGNQPQDTAGIDEPDMAGTETAAPSGDTPQETPDAAETPVNDPSQGEDQPSESTAPPSSLNAWETAVPDANASLETVETVTPEPTPEPTPVTRRLGINASIPYDQLHIGDTLILTAEMSGYDGMNVTLQWQQSVDGAWENIEGATDATLAVSITEDNINRAWRYSIVVEP